MYRFHELTAARATLLIAFAAYGLAAAIVSLYLEPCLLQVSALAAIVLATGLEYRRCARQARILLRVDPLQRGVELRQAGQPYFYSKYKVYQTRWFAILRLIDQRKGRILILTPGSFSSVESYRGLRFDLRRLERDHAA